MSGVFCLYIRVKLKTDAIPEFLERWGKLASHVRANEPETLSYELCRSDQNEDERSETVHGERGGKEESTL